MMKKTVIGCFIVMVFTGGSYVAYSSISANLSAKNEMAGEANVLSQSIEEIQEEQGKPVKVATITQKDIELTETFYGTVIPHAEANVQGKYGGRITLLKGVEGDSVTAGEVIVRFDQSDMQLQLQQAIAGKNSALQSVKQAESNFEMAQTDFNRYQQLLKDGFVSKQSIDAMHNQVQVAQAGLQSAREQVKNTEVQIKLLENTLKDMEIKAPISGVIDKKYFNLNEISGKDATIYHVVDLDQVYIEVEVPESYISQVQEEMIVTISFDSLKGREFSGTIERIIPTGNPQSRNFTVKVLVENSDHTIKPGMFARVNVCLEEIPATLVFNKKALLKEGEDYYVFKVVGNQVEKVAVEVKQRNNTTVAVLSEDLQPQDQVVIEGVRLLHSDDRVKIM